MNPFEIKSGYAFYWHNIKAIFSHKQFAGWGRKRSGRFASWCAKTFNGQCTLYEDGFIRSMGLGVNGAPMMSVVEDDLGIYYDATQPSRLEKLLNEFEFSDLPGLVNQAEQAIDQVLKHQISKYNLLEPLADDYFDNNESRVLVIAQTAGDASLKYGLAEQFTTQQMVQAALQENPGSVVYLKIHPDVVAGKKESDISLEWAKQHVQIIKESVNPVSLLKHFNKVYTKTSQMGFEALLMNIPCVCFGMPFYSGWGVTDDRVPKNQVALQRRTRQRTVTEIFAIAFMVYTKYFNPYRQEDSDIFDTIATIVRFKEQAENLKYLKNTPAYLFGFSRWKHKYIKLFLVSRQHQALHFVNPFLAKWFGQTHLNLAKQKGLLTQNTRPAIYIWGKREFTEIEEYATQNNLPVFRVEDGFVRSNALGSDLTQPYSLVIDSQGIYFDATQPSDLESILQHYDFEANQALLKRARQVIEYLVKNKVSKYNVYANSKLLVQEGKKIILVPGQVEDDASIQFGAKGMTNLMLLKQTRAQCPDAHIIYKPHPDVLVGNRVGHIEPNTALKYCNQIITKVGIDTVLEQADEVHTMTSLVGFEALLRNKKVVTYGMPFYAGWGLTEDRKICARRTARLNLPGLVAGSLLLYPQYIDPKNNNKCELEAVFKGLHTQTLILKGSFLRRSQLNIRNIIVRFALKMISKFN